MPPTPEPLIRRSLLQSGYSDAEILQERRSGRWASLRRGSYLDAQTDVELDPVRRHELLIEATLAGLRRPAVVSHCSAAVLLGIPLWSTPLRIVHVTRRPPAHSGRSAQLVFHAADLRPDEVLLKRGLAVTTPARTIADLARSLPFEQAVVAADAALRRNLTAADLEVATDRAKGVPGSRRMLRTLQFADGRSESVGESRSRVLMTMTGLPAPDLQFEVFGDDGMLIGRSDFAWRGGKVLGEFDGKVKYGRLLRPGESAGDAVFREKRREDALRDSGARVIRWVWADLAQPERLAARIQAALDSVG